MLSNQFALAPRSADRVEFVPRFVDGQVRGKWENDHLLPLGLQPPEKMLGAGPVPGGSNNLLRIWARSPRAVQARCCSTSMLVIIPSFLGWLNPRSTVHSLPLRRFGGLQTHGVLQAGHPGRMHSSSDLPLDRWDRNSAVQATSSSSRSTGVRSGSESRPGVCLP